MTVKQIKNNYTKLRQSIRTFLVNFLLKQENEMYANLILNPEDSIGLADVYKPSINIYKSNDNIIFIQFNETEKNYIEFDETDIDLLILIIESIELLK